MSGKKDNKDTEFENDSYVITERRSSSHMIRRVSPIGMRVLVKIAKESNKTDTGLYLPEGAKESMQESLLAEVLEVASATDESSDEETNISGIPKGASVLIPKYAGIRIPWDDNLRLVETKEVLAVIHEFRVS